MKWLSAWTEDDNIVVEVHIRKYIVLIILGLCYIVKIYLE